MNNLKGSRFGLYRDLLKSSLYFKLVCGAGNEDIKEVNYIDKDSYKENNLNGLKYKSKQINSKIYLSN